MLMTDSIVLSKDGLKNGMSHSTAEREYDNELFLSEIFGNIITSGNNKNIICLIEAKPGQGKSWTALTIACACAIHLATKLGGNPWDYFNIDHVGIIMPDEITKIVSGMKKYGVYILDDIGMAYAGRKWQSKGNEAMNNMLQTMRTDNNIIMMTVPDSDWIDKIGRNILHFKIVMKQPLHSMGYSLGRLVTVEKMYNSTSRKNLFPYLKLPDKIYNYALFSKPPNDLTEIYESRRAVQLKRLKSHSEKGMTEQVNDFFGKVTEKPQKTTKKERGLELIRDVEAGVYETLKQAAKANNFNYSYLRSIKYEETS